jgi:hypothetical protein
MTAVMTAGVLLVPITLVGVVLAWAESDPPKTGYGRFQRLQQTRQVPLASDQRRLRDAGGLRSDMPGEN